MSASINSFPSLRQIHEFLSSVQQEHPEAVTVEPLGQSVQRRPIDLVSITDRSVPEEDKQIVLVVSGEHGNEKTGVTNALAGVRWLLSDEAAGYRKRMICALILVANPDGYQMADAPDLGKVEVAHDGSDIRGHLNAKGVDTYHDHTAPGGPTQPESQAVRAAIDRLRPEVMLCIHGGWILGDDMKMENESANMYATAAKNYRDYYTHAKICELMDLRAMERGYHQQLRPFQYTKGNPLVVAYGLYHTIALTLHSHHEESFVAKLERLLEIGSSRWPEENDAGFPNRVIVDSSYGSLVACGKTAAELRQGRSQLWRVREKFTFPTLPPKYGVAGATLDCKEWLTCRAGLRCRLPKGVAPTRVTLDGREVGKGDYGLWRGLAATYVEVPFEAKFPRNIRVNYA